MTKRSMGATAKVQALLYRRCPGHQRSPENRKGEKLYLLPVKGSDTNWYKNILTLPRCASRPAGKNGAQK